MKSKLGIGCSILVCVFISLLEAADELVVYSGRSKSLVDPIIKQFGKESGVKIAKNPSMMGETVQSVIKGQ